MSDELIEPLHASHASAPISHFEIPGHPVLHRPGLVITGKIVAVSHGHPHHGEHHQLDVSVGGGEFTEILIRVPNAAYGHIEGRNAKIHVDPA
jgi:hypothetical protein